MKDNVREKLRTVLNKGSLEEVEVVYILSRIRILLEIDNEKTTYRTLNFYCSWVLHNKLDRQQTTAFLAKKFDIDDSPQISAKIIAQKLTSGHKNFFALNDLKDDLKTYFKSHDLPWDKLANDWSRFRKSLLEIILNCPIIFASHKLYSMECERQNSRTYAYKFTLVTHSRDKPIVKLKLK